MYHYPNGWFIMENLIKMDHLGVFLFLEASEASSPIKKLHISKLS